MKEKLTYFIKVITGKYYKEKVEELNDILREQNKIIRTKEKELDFINVELTEFEKSYKTLAKELNSVKLSRDELVRAKEAEIEQLKVDSKIHCDAEIFNLKCFFGEQINHREEIINQLNKKLERKEKTIEKKEVKLIEKEKERKAAVKELKKVNKIIDEQNKEITQLKEQVEFLKSHKRAPSLEEIKIYTSGRKHTKVEGK